MQYSLLVAAAILSTVIALECNICGPGTNNIIGDPQGVVTINYDGSPRKQNCLKWQQGSFLSEEWCEVNILNYTTWSCKCLLPDGTFLQDVIEAQKEEEENDEEVDGELDLPDGTRPDGQERDQVEKTGNDSSGNIVRVGLSVVAAMLAAML